MIRRLIDYARFQQALLRVNVALSRAAAVQATLRLDSTCPTSWEFSGFSQNGEDGIVNFLLRQLNTKNRQFLEIGSADGLENNTAWLAIAHKFCGTMIEGSPKLSAYAGRVMARFNMGIHCQSLFVKESTVEKVLESSATLEPDVFSLDIDGNDYYIMQWLLKAGLKPKIIVVEYNSALGPERPLTVSYQEHDFLSAHPSGLYYGVGIAAWKALFEMWGYQFIGVESHGVNGFFVNPQCFDPAFLSEITPVSFQENFFQSKKFNEPWNEQFKRIEQLPFKEVA